MQNASKACGEHDELTREARRLHAVLYRLGQEMMKPESPLNRSEDTSRTQLRRIAGDLRLVVIQVDTIVEKYASLSEDKRSGRKIWQKVRFGNGTMAELPDLRVKVVSYTSEIMFYINLVSMGTIGRIERRLGKFEGVLKDIKVAVERTTFNTVQKASAGSSEGSVLTVYADDETGFWRQFRRDLISQGFPSRVIRRHKDLIQGYIKELGARGMFDDVAEEVDKLQTEATVGFDTLQEVVEESIIVVERGPLPEPHQDLQSESVEISILDSQQQPKMSEASEEMLEQHPSCRPAEDQGIESRVSDSTDKTSYLSARKYDSDIPQHELNKKDSEHAIHDVDPGKIPPTDFTSQSSTGHTLSKVGVPEQQQIEDIMEISPQSVPMTKILSKEDAAPLRDFIIETVCCEGRSETQSPDQAACEMSINAEIDTDRPCSMKVEDPKMDSGDVVTSFEIKETTLSISEDSQKDPPRRTSCEGVNEAHLQVTGLSPVDIAKYDTVSPECSSNISPQAKITPRAAYIEDAIESDAEFQYQSQGPHHETVVAYQESADDHSGEDKDAPRAQRTYVHNSADIIQDPPVRPPELEKDPERDPGYDLYEKRARSPWMDQYKRPKRQPPLKRDRSTAATVNTAYEEVPQPESFPGVPFTPRPTPRSNIMFHVSSSGICRLSDGIDLSFLFYRLGQRFSVISECLPRQRTYCLQRCCFPSEMEGLWYNADLDSLERQAQTSAQLLKQLTEIVSFRQPDWTWPYASLQNFEPVAFHEAFERKPLTDDSASLLLTIGEWIVHFDSECHDVVRRLRQYNAWRRTPPPPPEPGQYYPFEYIPGQGSFGFVAPEQPVQPVYQPGLGSPSTWPNYNPQNADVPANAYPHEPRSPIQEQPKHADQHISNANAVTGMYSMADALNTFSKLFPRTAPKENEVDIESASTSSKTYTNVPETIFHEMSPANKISSLLRTFHFEHVPLCNKFISDPPASLKDRRKLFDSLTTNILEQVIIEADTVTSYDEGVKTQKRNLIVYAQATLERLDKASDCGKNSQNLELDSSKSTGTPAETPIRRNVQHSEPSKAAKNNDEQQRSVGHEPPLDIHQFNTTVTPKHGHDGEGVEDATDQVAEEQNLANSAALLRTQTVSKAFDEMWHEYHEQIAPLCIDWILGYNDWKRERRSHYRKTLTQSIRSLRVRLLSMELNSVAELEARRLVLAHDAKQMLTALSLTTFWTWKERWKRNDVGGSRVVVDIDPGNRTIVSSAGARCEMCHTTTAL